MFDVVVTPVRPGGGGTQANAGCAQTQRKVSSMEYLCRSRQNLGGLRVLEAAGTTNMSAVQSKDSSGVEPSFDWSPSAACRRISL